MKDFAALWKDLDIRWGVCSFSMSICFGTISNKLGVVSRRLRHMLHVEAHWLPLTLTTLASACALAKAVSVLLLNLAACFEPFTTNSRALIMVDSDEVARLKAEVTKLKAVVEFCKRHVPVEVRESINGALQGWIESSPSQRQESPSSMPEQQMTSNTEAVESAFGNASGLQKDGFRIIEFDPSRVQRAEPALVGPDRPPKIPKPTWKTTADVFLSNAPSAQQWNARVQSLGVSTSGSTYESIEQIFKPTQEPPESTIFDRAKRHIQQAADLIAGASYLLAKARMYLLCVLSYFSVLDTLQLVDMNDIYKLMKTALKVGAGDSDTYGKRVWDGAKWMSKELLNGLVEVGWTRAQVTTLYLFCTCFRPSHLVINAHINGRRTLPSIWLQEPQPSQEPSLHNQRIAKRGMHAA